MDKNSAVVVHYNPHLNNQTLYRDYLVSGFEKLCYKVTSTTDKNAEGDVHVCIGPHYAFDECLGKPTIYIDRCLWGDDLDAVSIGWVGKNEGMVYPKNSDDKRPKPELLPWVDNDESRAIVLCDYGEWADIYNIAKKHYGDVTLRHHPSTGGAQPTLSMHLHGHGVAIGGRTSALVEAAIRGYPVITYDDRSPVIDISGRDIIDIVKPDRAQWLNNLSYAQWRGEEIKNGEALKYVIANNDTPTG